MPQPPKCSSVRKKNSFGIMRSGLVIGLAFERQTTATPDGLELESKQAVGIVVAIRKLDCVLVGFQALNATICS